MKSDKTYLIAPFGLSGHEVRVLQTICVISRNRARTYEMSKADESRRFDFAIVDRDDPEAMAAWERYGASSPGVPGIMVGRLTASAPSPYQLRRPILATRMLKLLDQMEVTDERAAFDSPAAVESPRVTPDLQTPEPQRASAEAPGAGFRALVVDDSLPIRRQIELELAPLVGRVDLAEDGERALDLVASKTYDIVFLDVVLPGMDGYKICRTIKHDKRTKGTPVIMLSGKSSPFDRVRGKLAGCDTYLTKPVDHATFAKVVQKYLKQRESKLVDRGVLLGRSIPGRA